MSGIEPCGHRRGERALELPGLAVVGQAETDAAVAGRAIASASVVGLAPALKACGEVAQELGAVGAVDEAVVVGQGQVHDRADRDRVLARRRRRSPRAA